MTAESKHITGTDALVSVIVPIYNVDQYLSDCIESLLAQSYTRLEIILVNDGSTDGSGKICEYYECRDDRIIYIEKDNGGLSDARNCGLRYATGDYISFVDSDDFVSPVFIESLLYAAQIHDCAIAALPGGTSFVDDSAISLVDDFDEAISRITGPIGSEEAVEELFYQKVATGAPWRLYNRQVLGDDPFPVGLYYEDVASTYKFLSAAKQIVFVSTTDLYAYRLRSDSIIRQQYSHAKGYSAITIANNLYEDVCERMPKYKSAAASRCFALARLVFAQLVDDDDNIERFKNDFDCLWIIIRKHRLTVVGDSKARRRERMAAIISYFGQRSFITFCRLARAAGLLR